MISLPDTLPDDPEQLTALLVAFERQAKENENAFQSQIKKLTNQLHDGFEALRLERVRRFASKSEKAPGQDELFDEAEADDVNEDTDVIATAEPNAPTQLSQKKASVRKPLPPELPRCEEVHELSAEDRICPCGCALEEIGGSVSEQLDIDVELQTSSDSYRF